jgi:hypothetical protein
MDELQGGDVRSQLEAHAELSDIARLAYIYGLPCYEVARLRYRALSLPRRGGNKLRLNAFWHSRELSTPSTIDVTAVNTDTLLSRAWLDLSQGPLVIRLPDTADRYYSLALMDIFTNNFAVLGRRTTGTAALDFFLAGPQWDGAAPTGMPLVRAPTNAVWALVRILVRGPDDLPAVHALQNLLTLSRPGAPAETTAPSPDPLSLPVLPFERTKPLIFLDVLNAVLTENPPPARDAPVLDRLRTIGVGPWLTFNRGDFPQPQLDALRQGITSAREAIRAQVAFRTQEPQRTGPSPWPSDALLAQLRDPVGTSPTHKDRRHGWSGPLGEVGNFGTDYLLRAQCALAGLGLLPREEAMYFTTATDAVGAELNGRSNYILRFSPAGLPPVDAFWSLTIYRSDENNRRWLVANAIDRYSIGNQTSGLRYDRDGSLQIRIAHDPPSTNENWLPAPEGRFLLTLRAYQPRRQLLDGRYEIPDVRCRRAFE